MSLKYILFFLLFFSGFLIANSIEGKVISTVNGAPLIGANVTLLEMNQGASTNNRGEFLISNIPDGNYLLSVDYVGYKLEDPLEITVQNGQSRPVLIEMREDILTGEDIVVTGTRTRRLIKDSPVATEVIHADEIRDMGAENVGEVLEERAGIIVTQDGARGGMLSAQLQGLDDNHTLVLIDGVPVIGRVAGDLDLSRVSTQNIDRIEIVKGAASALYGSEAVGGVINIITREPDDEMRYGGTFNMGSFNTRNLKMDFSNSYDRFSVTSSFESHVADGYDLDPRTANTTADDFQNFSIFNKAKYYFSDKFNMQLSSEYFQQNQEGFDGGIRKTDTKNWYLNLQPEWIFQNYSKLKAKLYHTQYHKEIERAGELITDNVENLSRGEFTYNRVYKNNIITFGSEITRNTLEAQRIQDNNKIVYNYSAYIQEELLFKMIEFNFGARADYHSEFDFNFSPKVGLLYKPSESWRFRASYSRGFRAPDFIELYLVLDHSTLTSQPYIANGNPGLKPETSSSYNLGAEYHFSKDALMRVNFFHNHLTDMINSKFLYTSNEGVQYYTYENLSEAFTRGIEYDMMVRFWNYFKFTGGYSYLDTKDLAGDEPFYNRPNHSARLKLDWGFDQLGLSGNVRWRYIGTRLFVNFQGEQTEAPWYALWHANLKQKIYKPLYLTLGVENLFDYQDRNYVALPGRLVHIGIDFKQ